MKEAFTAFSVMAGTGITGWIIADWPGFVATIAALLIGTAALAAADAGEPLSSDVARMRDA